MTSAINWVKEHRRELMAAFAALAVIVLIIGLCLSWFVFSKSLSTVGSIKQPAVLKLMGPNQTAITQIDLTYDPQNDVDKDGNITLKRPFCVKSAQQADYSLMLAHTTNINGLDIKLYKASAKKSPSASDASAYVAGNDETGAPFAWDIDKTVGDLLPQDSYINDDDGDGKADVGYDGQTFGNYTDLERSASPLYWELGGQNTGEDCLDNYVIELKWREAQKETDVLYLIALSS